MACLKENHRRFTPTDVHNQYQIPYPSIHHCQSLMLISSCLIYFFVP